MTERLPIALELQQFLDLPIEDRLPLMGEKGKAAIAAGGLVLLGGKAGLGKTTLIVDAIFHFASGIDWLGFTVGRPLNILIVENEGPMPMFQQKLAAKRAVWKTPLQGTIHVQTAAWGYFSFADHDHHAALSAYLDQHQIDLVVGDPIGTLGMEGVGAPDETRRFVQLLIPLGLFTNRAFIFPVHFTKEARKDEVDQISGAWGGHLDSLLILKATRRKDELRLSFPKLRWWNEINPKPLILGKVYNTQTFEILREEGDTEPLEQRIIELLSDGMWRTIPEIASKNTGIEGGARREDVKNTLEARPELFLWESGATHGRSARAVVFSLVPTPGTNRSPQTEQPSQTELVPRSGTSRDESDEYGPDLLVPAQRDEWDESDNGRVEASLDTRPHDPPSVGGGLGLVDEPTDQLLVPASGTTNGADPDRIPYSAAELDTIAATQAALADTDPEDA